jgi:hypothetical protein
MHTLSTATSISHMLLHSYGTITLHSVSLYKFKDHAALHVLAGRTGLTLCSQKD